VVDLAFPDRPGPSLVQHDESALPDPKHRALALDVLQRQVVTGLKLQGNQRLQQIYI
jgi:hypothetical protein